ncbi:MAG TPA: biotin-dependent carboxyltransferase family protein, partial [Methylomirabilota bacterium]|nr:biotin-dependent carboxyltransferase family protein [Methylomirabilota bacterium]
ALVMKDGGLFSTIQDAGRFGYQRFGISASGAMDAVGLRLANALAGNPPGMAAIETTMSGPTFTVEADRCRIAVAGDVAVTISGKAAESWRAHELVRGDVVRIGAMRTGMRGYVAVTGGFDIPPVLGSLSTHTRSGIGGLDGGPLKAGDRLALCAPAASGPCLALGEAHRPRVGRGTIRVMLGPQADAFTDAGIETFLTGSYSISSKADRMGYQFDGPPIEHRSGFNVVSDGIMNGSIQVPGSRRPIVLLADRQSTGGYPKIATVVEPDLPALGQARPGDTLRFEAIDGAAAEALARRHRDAVSAMVAAIAPARAAEDALTADRLLGFNLVGGVVSGTSDPFDPAASHDDVDTGWEQP